MDLPSPIRSVATVDYFTPLHVDTSTEYTLDMEKFPDFTEQCWEPALVIASNTETSQMNLEVTSSLQLIPNDNLQELSILVDKYDICNLQEGDVDFGLTDLPPSPLGALDSTGDYLESSLESDLELSVECVFPDLTSTDSGVFYASDKSCDCLNFLGDTFVPCQETTTTCVLQATSGRCHRKRSVSIMCEEAAISVKVCKRRISEDISDSAPHHVSIGIAHQKGALGESEKDLFRRIVYPAQTSLDTDYRQW